MIKAILFDFWGTLVEQGVWSPVKQVKNLLEIDLPFPDYIIRMERAFMTKNFSSLKEAFEALCQEFNLPPDPEKIEELIGLWNKAWLLAQPYSEVNEALSKLKEKYQLILISNTDSFSVPQVLEKFQLTPLFNQIFLSNQLGLIKTDKNFLKTVLTELNLSPEECILVGDSLQSDIIAAKKAGLQAVLIDRKNSLEYQPKIKNLKELETFIP